MGRPAKHPDQFRRNALALVQSSGRPIAEVARSLGIAEVLQLHDAIAVLELDRVLDSSPHELDRHRRVEGRPPRQARRHLTEHRRSEEDRAPEE
jgi:transposase-like protein